MTRYSIILVGDNPNVLFEIGIAYGSLPAESVILLSTIPIDSSKLPFDIRNRRISIIEVNNKKKSSSDLVHFFTESLKSMYPGQEFNKFLDEWRFSACGRYHDDYKTSLNLWLENRNEIKFSFVPSYLVSRISDICAKYHWLNIVFKCSASDYIQCPCSDVTVWFEKSEKGREIEVVQMDADDR